jgi:hypothetical protein
MDALAQTPLTMCTMKATIAAGTTSTLSTTGTTLYCIKGKAYSKGALTNQATPTTDSVTGAAFVAVAAGYGCAFVVSFDSSGNLKVSQGPQQVLDGVTDGANAKFLLAPQMAPVVDTHCPIGYIVVKVGTSGAAWTFGTSNLTGPPANTLVTFVDVMTLPDRPQVA